MTTVKESREQLDATIKELVKLKTILTSKGEYDLYAKVRDLETTLSSLTDEDIEKVNKLII